MDILRQFPALWMVFGLVLASGAFLYANKKIFAWQKEATQNLIGTLKENISTLTTERNGYRDTLHTVRNDLGSQINAAQIRIKDLELRPDMTLLFETSKDFYTNQAEVQAKQATAMQQLIDAIHKHDSDVEGRMIPIYESLKTMGDGIKELLQRTPPKRTRLTRVAA